MNLAGKETPLKVVIQEIPKVVIQEIPTYTISVFKLPRKLRKDIIASMISNL